MQKLYSVESVTSGHPDKICDQISDAILDACLEQDPYSRVAIETFGGHGLVVVGGEITSTAEVDYAQIARTIYQQIGYNENLEIITRVVKQSPDIAQGVNVGGAGDQGIMYGFATNATSDYLPLGVGLVHDLTRKLEQLRKTGELSFLRPDGKAQVTIANGKVRTVLVSTQHSADVARLEILAGIRVKLVEPLIADQIELLVNPTGQFIQGGFDADTGLTGRKLMVDTYGGLIPHGGGCFSGKDATKVDRSAAYMCRFVAKNLVVNGYAQECLVSVAYAIGRAEPLMIEATTETGQSLAEVVKANFDFRPAAIIERLELRKPIYKQTAVYGHFTKPNLTWEQTIEF